MNRFANGIWVTISAVAMITIYIGSTAIYLWSLYIVWGQGFLSFALTTLLPVIAQIYWAIKIWIVTGTFFNWYTMGVTFCALCIPIAVLSAMVSSSETRDTGSVIAKTIGGLALLGLAIVLGFSILANPSSRLYMNKIATPWASQAQAFVHNPNTRDITNAFIYAKMAKEKIAETGLWMKLTKPNAKDVKGDFQDVSDLFFKAYASAEKVSDSYLEDIGAGFKEKWRTEFQPSLHIMADGFASLDARKLQEGVALHDSFANWLAKNKEFLKKPK